MNRYAIGFAVVLLTIAGCTSKPVINVTQAPIPTLRNGNQPSLEQVERAILAAAHNRGWSPRVIEQGAIEAELAVRLHRATVDIPFTEDVYSIIYKDSEQLDYRNGRIHRNYNRWIMNLSKSIRRELGVTVK